MAAVGAELLENTNVFCFGMTRENVSSINITSVVDIRVDLIKVSMELDLNQMQ